MKDGRNHSDCKAIIVIKKLVTFLQNKKAMMFYTIAPVYQTKKSFRRYMGYKLDLVNPRTINEKLQYLKLNDYYNNPLVSMCADKYGIREYLTSRGMPELLPKIYGVYESALDIDWERLPNSFVIKCNHGCGYNILCPDASKLDKEKAIKQLSYWLKQDYWKRFGEFHYRLIKKKIIVEEYLGDNIATYKFYCFNGVAKLLYLSFNGENGEKDKYITYYDLGLKQLPYKLFHHETKNGDVEKPKNYDLMISYVNRISSEFPFVRVDLYNIDGKIYISELTFFPTGGHMRLEPKEADLEWGKWLSVK